MQRSSKIQQFSVNNNEKSQIGACKICQNLDVDEFEQEDYPSYGLLRLQRHLGEIKRSSWSGCQFCRVVAESIQYLSGDLSDSQGVLIRFSPDRDIDYVLQDTEYPYAAIYSLRG